MKETQENPNESLPLSSAITQSLNKFNQGLKDENKFQRKNALESMKKQLVESFNSKGDASLKFPFEIIKTIMRSSLNAWNDSVEKCRECSCEIVKLILENLQNWDTDMTSMLLMTLHHRLGGKDVKEPSEEIRLELYKLMHRLIEDKSSQQKNIFEVHFQELVSILCNSFNDMYPEVKKTGCLCARLLALKLKGSNFHMQSETLVKPLLTNLTHQHSRVRKDIVECLCDVVMYGNNKSVTEIIPHLAQRLFDQAHTVRLAVIKLVGTWLLDLPDRYSFWHRLIPLLLTGFIDENAEIKEITESLWWDIGIKYEKENDEELKDKANFLEKDLENYPKEFLEKRGNLGCRELIRQNASKILPGILNDTGDWVEATRIKSIQLLLIMIWQTEYNLTQHLETVLQTLFKASTENHDIIQSQIAHCSRLVGHFTDPNLSLKFAIKSVKKMITPNHGSLNILNGLLMGHSGKVPFDIILETLHLLNEICLTVDAPLQIKILDCCLTLLPITKYESQSIEPKSLNEFEYLIFKTSFTLSALTNESGIKESINAIIINMDREKIIQRHLLSFVNELSENCDSWNDNSLEPSIFTKLLIDCGLSNTVVDQVVNILKITLDPSKDAQMRTRFLLLIPQIFLSSFMESCFETILNNMIMPNIIWKAGKSANAVRMSAVASLALIMQIDVVKSIEIHQETVEKFLKMMMSCLDDDNKSTRLYVCKLFIILFNNYRTRFTKDQLHLLYPEFIKRLDDHSDEIRFEILKAFSIYIDCLNNDYDKILYQAHLKVIFENLLLYLDDANFDIQLKVFGLLKHASVLNSELLLEETNKVKSKHRNTQYCEDLIKYCKNVQN